MNPIPEESSSYPTYQPYSQYGPQIHTTTNEPYPYNNVVKEEQSYSSTPYNLGDSQNQITPNEPKNTSENQPPENQPVEKNPKYFKMIAERQLESLKRKRRSPRTPRKVKIKKEPGEKSSYFSKKITDKNFNFYGCAVCDLSYPSLLDLDNHMASKHKDRVSSYVLRLKNKRKSKRQIKNQKGRKKGKKPVKEVKEEMELEIKPEDGYIGTETKSEYENAGQNTEADSNADTKEETKNRLEEKQKRDAVSNLEKIYKCYACSKQFHLSYYLKLHVRSHTDEKPYICNVCGETFITASKLGRHNKRTHLAIKCQCRICFKIFNRFENLVSHFDKIHADDKLDGEVYDFYAILPYLQEAEQQQLLEDQKIHNVTDLKKEENDKEEDMTSVFAPSPRSDMSSPDISLDKIKTEPKAEPVIEFLQEHWSDRYSDPESPDNDTTVQKDSLSMDGEEGGETNADIERPFFDVVIEEPFDASKVEIKVEQEEIDEELLKKDDGSDEDYFPTNTWASTPEISMVPEDPKQTTDDYETKPKRRKRKGQKEDGSLQCEVCNKVISSATYMVVHMRTHSGERPYKCYVCQRGFITASKMHRHVMTHKDAWNDEEKKSLDVKLEVEIEKKEGSDSDDKDDESLKEVKKRYQKERKRKKIKLEENDNDKEKEKKKRNVKKRPFGCEFCNKKFLHQELLNIHKKCHEGQTPLAKRCHYCLLEGDDEQALKDHEATHTGPKPFLCTTCGRCYKKKESMVYHKKSHKSEKTFICDICSKSFNADCKLQRHIVSHRSEKFVLKYECPVCAHMFHTKYHIQMHLTTHMKEGLILEENRSAILAMVLQNARKFPKPGETLNATDIPIAPDERSRVCNICGQVFQHFYYLEEHLKSHGSKIAIEDEEKVEEKKYVCQVCNKSFKLHYYLKLHSYTHTKEKPFICQQCGKGFITRGKLKRHIETHSGLKKFQCHVCYKFFTRPSYLRIHVRTIHGTQDYNFSVVKQYGLSAAMTSLSENSGC